MIPAIFFLLVVDPPNLIPAKISSLEVNSLKICPGHYTPWRNLLLRKYTPGKYNGLSLSRTNEGTSEVCLRWRPCSRDHRASVRVRDSTVIPPEKIRQKNNIASSLIKIVNKVFNFSKFIANCYYKGQNGPKY